MIKFKEVPNPTNPNAQRLEVTSTGVKPKVQSGNKEDALWDFFNLKNAKGTVLYVACHLCVAHCVWVSGTVITCSDMHNCDYLECFHIFSELCSQSQ